MARCIDLTRLSGSHPGLYWRRVEDYVECLAVRLRAKAGAIVRWKARARPNNRSGRVPRESWDLIFPSTLSPTDLSLLATSEPANRITEEAAIALAAVGVAEVAALRIREVTLSGDRGDYWLETVSGVSAGLLEVSGSISTKRKPAAIYRAKRRQVLLNKKSNCAYASISHLGEGLGYFCRVR
jgi:hypothetical protein